jgi:hypothetical protein
MPQQVVAVVLALFLGIAPVSTSPAQQVTRARIEATITTTSDWAVVEISRGRLAVSQEVSRPADVTVTPTTNGWALHSPPGVSRTIKLRGVFEEPSGARTFRIALQKGSGRTVVDIRNTTGTAFLAARVGNIAATTATTLGSFVQWRTRAQFLGTKQIPLTRADVARHVLAVYYGWYSSAAYNDPRLSDRPADRIGTQEYPDVLAHTRLARSGGIDGFLVDYDGTGNPALFANALHAAETVGGVATPYLEIVNAKSDDPAAGTKPAVVLDWLRTVLANASSPAFLRSGGEPVVFIFEMARVGVAGWKKILDALAQEGLHVRLVGDAPLATYGSVEWGIHSYNAAIVKDTKTLAVDERATMLESRLLTPAYAGGSHLNVATVTPGFDDHAINGDAHAIVERGAGGERYAATWEAAFWADPDWVVVTSWNEWFESSAVQPSETYGDLALRQTATMAERFRSHG